MFSKPSLLKAFSSKQNTDEIDFDRDDETSEDYVDDNASIEAEPVQTPDQTIVDPQERIYIKELIKRQDDLMEQLDHLNGQIESIVDLYVAERKAETEAALAEANSGDEQVSTGDESTNEDSDESDSRLADAA